MRKTPAGTRIARWYCRKGHCTFSLLPDQLAVRLPGTLAEIEQAASARRILLYGDLHYYFCASKLCLRRIGS